MSMSAQESREKTVAAHTAALKQVATPEAETALAELVAANSVVGSVEADLAEAKVQAKVARSECGPGMAKVLQSAAIILPMLGRDQAEWLPAGCEQANGDSFQLARQFVANLHGKGELAEHLGGELQKMIDGSSMGELVAARQEVVAMREKLFLAKLDLKRAFAQSLKVIHLNTSARDAVRKFVAPGRRRSKAEAKVEPKSDPKPTAVEQGAGNADGANPEVLPAPAVQPANGAVAA